MAIHRFPRHRSLAALGVAWLLCACVQAGPSGAPVVVHGAGSSADLAALDTTQRDPAELEDLVGPVALYPDDLLAIVLPASTFPLQVVEAARYLRKLQDDPAAEPDDDWDESVVALLNYPEVVEKLSEDLDWTWALGQAVMEQEQDVLAAVERFRRDAYAAGNLASDHRQRVEVHERIVEIVPADPEVIYVPYYEPRLMRARRSYPVFHYYPEPCPVYYYPYPAGHYLMSDHFWGVTSAFSIGWQTRNLYLYRHDYRGHPYYGRPYAYRHYRYWHPRQRQWAHDRVVSERKSDHRWHPERYYQGVRPLPHRRPEPRGARPPDQQRREVPGTRTWQAGHDEVPRPSLRPRAVLPGDQRGALAPRSDQPVRPGPITTVPAPRQPTATPQRARPPQRADTPRPQLRHAQPRPAPQQPPADAGRAAEARVAADARRAPDARALANARAAASARAAANARAAADARAAANTRAASQSGAAPPGQARSASAAQARQVERAARAAARGRGAENARAAAQAADARARQDGPTRRRGESRAPYHRH